MQCKLMEHTSVMRSFHRVIYFLMVWCQIMLPYVTLVPGWEVRLMYYTLALGTWTYEPFIYIIQKTVIQIFYMSFVKWGNIHVWSDFMMTSSNGNIFRVTGPLGGNSPVTVNSPHKGQWRENLIRAWINYWAKNHKMLKTAKTYLYVSF